MRNRLDGDQALDIAKQVVAENPGISQEEMNEKAEALARMVRENSPPAEMPISRAGPTMKMSEPIERLEPLEPRMETIPQYQEAEGLLGISDEPGRYYDAAEPKSDFEKRMRASPMGQRTTKQIELIKKILEMGADFNQAAADLDIGINTPMGPAGTPGYMLRRMSPDDPWMDPILDIGINTPMGPAGTPGYMLRRMYPHGPLRGATNDAAEPKSDFEKRQSDFEKRLDARREQVLRGATSFYPEEMAPDAAERRQTPGTSVTMDYTMGQSQQLAELRSDPAFGVGFRQGINDYEKMKSESPDTIIDDLSGSIDEANMARESLFRGNVDPRDLKRLGYAEAMEYADREEKNIDEKALRQGMMDR